MVYKTVRSIINQLERKYVGLLLVNDQLDALFLNVFMMMSTCYSKHVEAWNKYIEKECVKLAVNQNYVEIHGQQNIKCKATAK
jgi:hypothetical protein